MSEPLEIKFELARQQARRTERALYDAGFGRNALLVVTQARGRRSQEQVDVERAEMAVRLTPHCFPFGNELTDEFREELFEKLLAPQRPERMGGEHCQARTNGSGTIRRRGLTT